MLLALIEEQGDLLRRRLERFPQTNEVRRCADQPERLEQLRATVAIARRDPPRVDRAGAADWLEHELQCAADGVCTLVYHSSLWIYLSQEEQTRVQALLSRRGAEATAKRPLAWLRHQDSGDAGAIEIRLVLWPAGEQRILGKGHPHGRFVEWGTLRNAHP